MEELHDDYLSRVSRAFRAAGLDRARDDGTVLQDDALNDPDGSAAGFAYRYAARKKELAQAGRSGDWGRFYALYKDLEDVVTANPDTLNGLLTADMASVARNRVAQEVVNGAKSATQYEHRDVEFKLDDGTTVTAAEYYNHPERYSQPKTYGFTKADMDLYNGKALLPDGTPDVAAHDVLEPLVGKVVKAHDAGVSTADVASRGRPGSSPLRNVVQLTDAGHFVAGNLVEFRSHYGNDGTKFLSTWASDTLGDSGGIQDVLEAALVHARGNPADPVESDGDRYESARRFVRAFDEVMSSTFRRPGREAEYTPSERRWMVKAVADVVRLDPDVAIDSEGAKAGLARAADVFARYRAMGMDLSTMVGREALQKDLAEYVRAWQKTGYAPSNNRISRLASLHDGLAGRVAATSADRPVPAQPTGDANAYRNNMARETGHESSNPSASAIQKALIGNFEKAVARFMVADGATEADAAALMLADKDASAAFAERTDDEIMRAGAFRTRDAAAQIRNAFLGTLRNGGRFVVEDWIRRKGFDPALNGLAVDADGNVRFDARGNPVAAASVEPRAAQALEDYRQWTEANAGNRLLGEEAAQLLAVYMSPFGGRSQAGAVARLAKVNRNVADMVRQRKPLSAIRAYLATEASVGVFTVPDDSVVYNPAGRPLSRSTDDSRMAAEWDRAFVKAKAGQPADANGRLLDERGDFVLRPGYRRGFKRVSGDIRKYPQFGYGDKHAFDRMQSLYAAEEAATARLAAGYASKLGAAAAKYDPYVQEASAAPSY